MSNRYLITVLAATFTFSAPVSWAQSPSAANAAAFSQLSPDDRQKALQVLQGRALETSDAPPLAPARPLSRPRPQVRGKEGELPLFGYSLFSSEDGAYETSADVPIPQNYVLGPGDIIRLQLFGNQNETLNLSVTRDGAVNLPKLGPVQVAGLSVDDARVVIERRVAKELIGVQTNITLGPLRGMQVFLLGDARQPGAYSVSGLATITQALIAGGGIANTGSLRKIELKRAGRTIQRIDLYDFLLRGDASRDVRLQSGDAVFVPAVGPRVAIAGAVTRPAVYELAGTLTVKEALLLAGGLTGNARRAQLSLERVGRNGERQLLSLDARDDRALAMTLRDGDRLDIGALYESAENPVTVLGHVRYEKSFPWNAELTLAQVLTLAEVRPSEPGRELYPVMALVERSDPATGLRNWHGFDLLAVQQGKFDEPVAALDRVLVLTRADVNYLLATEVRNALSGQLPKPVTEFAVSAAASEVVNPERAAAMKPAVARGDDICPALLEVVKMSDAARAVSIRVLLEGQASAAENRFQQARSAQAATPETASDCPEAFRAAPTALTYLLEHSVGLVGEVRQPGLYPFVQGTTLERLVAVAGGETAEVNRAELEFFNVGESAGGVQPRFERLQRNASLAEQPAVQAIYKFLPAAAALEVGAVNVRGEVRFPGRYVITRNERYSELIARAGGLNENAFALGTVFTRASAREQERAANRRAAADLRESLVTVATEGSLSQSNNQTANAAVVSLVEKLETMSAVGRVVIEADPAIVSGSTDADFLLEPGDEIFIPKRPNSVAVTGQVLSPGSLAFVSGGSSEDYIKQAGGFSQSADGDRTFLVLPNGEARPLQRSFWLTDSQAIPPGSVIVVPRDVSPFNSLLLTERITSILSNLALSAAALLTISR